MNALQRAAQAATTAAQSMPRKGTRSKYSGQPIEPGYIKTRTVQAGSAYVNACDIQVLPSGTQELPDLDAIRGKLTKGRYYIDLRPIGKLKGNEVDTLAFLAANYHARAIATKGGMVEVAAAPQVNRHGTKERLQGLDGLISAKQYKLIVGKLDWTKSNINRIRAAKRELFAQLPAANLIVTIRDTGLELTMKHKNATDTAHTSYLLGAFADILDDYATRKADKATTAMLIREAYDTHKAGAALYQREERNNRGAA